MRGSRRVRGEEALIQEYFAPLAAALPGAYGLADDCACLSVPHGEELVVTTDAVAAGVHFLPDDDPADIAWKALAVNVSDLAAKGARPFTYVMSLAFPDLPEPTWLNGFSGGLKAAQDALGLVLAGGDTDRRPGPLSITITAFGTVPANRMVLRSTARPGDLLFVSGSIGDSALGLNVRRDASVAARWGLDEQSAAALVARYLRPEPRLGLMKALREHASAAMDISDGLAKDADRLARTSGVAVRISGADVPLSAPARAVAANVPEIFSSLVTGGDDFEVLAAVPEHQAAAFQAAASSAGIAVTIIGEFSEGSGLHVTGMDGRPLALDDLGWDHFFAR